MTTYASVTKQSVIDAHKKTLTILMENHKREFSNLEKSNRIWLQIVPLMREISQMETPTEPNTIYTRDYRWDIIRDDD